MLNYFSKINESRESMSGKKFFKKATAITLTAGLILSSSNFIHTAKVSATSINAEKVLESLTPQQRDALTQLELSDQNGLQGFNGVELNSEQEMEVIVQFHSKPSHVAILDAEVKGKKLTQKKADDQILKEHEKFKKDIQTILPKSNLKNKKTDYQITYTYNTVYNGLAMKLPANQVESLLKSDVVKAVYKNEIFRVDPIVQNTSGEEEGTTPGISVEAISHLKVDKLHEEGFTGKGIKVGVLDTGIDYNHPDLKDVYKGGYDLVDNDNDPMETTYNDWKASNNPEVIGTSTYYTSHGTHVSGTIAGQAKNNDISVKGVASDVDLYAYRVLGPYGSGSTEGVIAGIEKSVEDGMDVINLSLGSSVNDPYYPTSIAINYAVLSGVTAVVAAGNTGPGGYTVGSPGTSALGITVGASDVPLAVSTFKGKIGSTNEIELINMGRNYSDQLKDLDGQSYEVVDVGLGSIVDYTDRDVQGKIVLLERGGFTLTDKVTIAKEKGAAIVLLYNNVDGQIEANLGESTAFVPAFSLTKTAGEQIKAHLQKGETSFTFSDYGVSQTEGDRLADFSSRGPVRKTDEVKPEVVAPGVSVLSTVPSFMADPEKQEDYQLAYARYSGTSMATPFTAGVAALLLQANPKLTPDDIKAILMNTADPLNGEYSVFEVGAGRVNPYNAIHHGAIFQMIDKTFIPGAEDVTEVKRLTGGLSFDNEMVDNNLVIKKSIHMKNNEKEKKKFSVTITEGSGSNGLKKNGMDILIANKINLKANEETKVSISLRTHKKAKEGYYTGYITLTNTEDSAEKYRIPYNFRLMQDGFNTLSIDNPAFSPYYFNNTDDWDAFRLPVVNSQINLSAPMEKLDIILQDDKGNDLGFVGTVSLDGAYDNFDYGLHAFFGTYNTFTGDVNNPISSKVSYAKEGHYKLKFIGTGLSGKTVTQTEHIWITLTKPTFTSSLDGSSPFIEFKPGQQTYPFEIKITDPFVDEMQKHGVNIDQTSNFMIYYWGYFGQPSTPIYMDKDGKFVEEILMSDSPRGLPFSMAGYNAAGNRVDKAYFFVKEGTPVTYPTSETTEANTGDIINMKLVLDNVKDIKKAEWTLQDFVGLKTLNLVEAKLTEDLKDKATISLKGNKITVEFNHPSGQLDQKAVVDISFEVMGEEYYTLGYMDPTVVVTDSNNNNLKVLNSPYRFKINPQFSKIEGYVGPEGFHDNDNLGSRDWSKVGGTVKAIDSNGNVIDGTSSVEDSGYYSIDKLPLSKDQYTLEMTVPGHFFTRTEVPLGYERNGVIYGNYQWVNLVLLLGGDVNQDGTIDVLDALAIQKAWKTGDRAADINFDGTVDAKDIEFVKKNYLKQNEDVENAPEPKQNHNGKTLEIILAELEI
ncbi:S8 family serine peptidase [Bacillus sp. B-jedd]|uniref:S8 family serine peptidase n=1 Tax=Bacillus sp. B-jedd TaxID=1476857 RepID=UPI000A5D4DA0|nr:S8 family serine peptidase [Bacillus sp. B-jedd]